MIMRWGREAPTDILLPDSTRPESVVVPQALHATCVRVSLKGEEGKAHHRPVLNEEGVGVVRAENGPRRRSSHGEPSLHTGHFQNPAVRMPVEAFHPVEEVGVEWVPGARSTWRSCGGTMYAGAQPAAIT